MLQFFSSDFAESLRALRSASQWISAGEPDARFAAMDRTHAASFVCHSLSAFRRSLGDVPLSEPVHAMLERLNDRARRAGDLADGQERAAILTLLDEFETSVLIEMRRHKYVAIPPDQQQYFEARDLFGADVAAKLPAASDDIQQAANALALGLYAGAAFYLLRVAELSIREFFIANTIVIPRRPNLADADWSELIARLDEWLVSEIIALGTPQRGSPERRRIDSYNALISDARFLKEERNKTMHCRHTWAESEVVAALSRVRSFAQRIASLIQ